MPRETWTTKSGEKLHITEMGDEHLLHALRMLRRNGGLGLSEVEFGHSFPPDSMAADAADREISDSFGRIHGSIDAMLAELWARGLSELPTGEQ